MAHVTWSSGWKGISTNTGVSVRKRFNSRRFWMSLNPTQLGKNKYLVGEISCRSFADEVEIPQSLKDFGNRTRHSSSQPRRTFTAGHCIMPGSQEKPSGWLVVCPSIRRTTFYTAIINPRRGLLARAQRSYAGKFWRIEVRSGKHKANEKRRGASKQRCVSPILVG
jgi:hypothetical protein